MKWIKSDGKDIYNVIKQINAFFSSKESGIFPQAAQLDNNKCFLSTKLAYYNEFWRIMWH